MDNHTLSVSSVFGPSQRGAPSDRTLRSSDSILFYINSATISKAFPNALQALSCSIPNDEGLESDEKVIDVPETSAVLNILLHTMYRWSCAKHAPSLQDLETAVRHMGSYGLCPKEVIRNTGSPTLFDMLLSFAPLDPLRVYTLAAQFDIYDLAVQSSSYLLSYDISTMSDDVAEAIGAIYLCRFMVLHQRLTETLKSILLQPPPPHDATEACDFGDQKRLARAWALTAAYVVWDPRPDMSVHDLQERFLGLASHIECSSCEQMLKRRVKEVAVQWVKVKVSTSASSTDC